jgi:hypothetical protein
MIRIASVAKRATNVSDGSDSHVRFSRASRQLHLNEPTFKALM